MVRCGKCLGKSQWRLGLGPFLTQRSGTREVGRVLDRHRRLTCIMLALLRPGVRLLSPSVSYELGSSFHLPDWERSHFC